MSSTSIKTTTLKQILLFTALLYMVASPAWAVIHPQERMDNPVLEQNAQNLYAALRCVVCEGQSIASSDTSIAADMRGIVRKLLTEGQSSAEITAYFHERYGDAVLMRPTVKRQTWGLWFTPLFILCSGLFLLFRMTGKSEEAS